MLKSIHLFVYRNLTLYIINKATEYQPRLYRGYKWLNLIAGKVDRDKYRKQSSNNRVVAYFKRGNT